MYVRCGTPSWVACVTDIRKGRGRARDRPPPPALSPSRAQICPSSSPFNTCLASYELGEVARL